jgi:hypothetical protein
MIRKLLKELDSVKKMDDPENEIGPKDKVIGDMTEDQKKLHTLSINLKKQAMEKRYKTTFSLGGNEKENFEKFVETFLRAALQMEMKEEKEVLEKFAELMEKADIIREIMWMDIKDHFHLWSHNIGIRKGFKVVVRD